MKTITAKLPHGWFKGKYKETDIIDTIETSIGRWDIVIIELEEPNNLIERERKVLIKDNTKMGYQVGEDGDGIDLGLNRSNHRGTVKKGISHTIKAECDAGVLEIEQSDSDRRNR